MESIGPPSLSSLLLQGDDYLAVIHAHCQCSQAASALHVLQKWQASPLTTTAAAHAAVIRCILAAPSCNSNSSSSTVHFYYDTRMGSRLSPVEMAHALLEQCLEGSGGDGSHQTPSVHVYNRVLDAWSRALPPFSKKRRQQQARDIDSRRVVVEKAEWIWNAMLPTVRNAKSHVLMIYTYCKSGHIDQAHAIWELLLRRLLLLPSAGTSSSSSSSSELLLLERVDVKSVRMLVNALSAVSDTTTAMEAPKRIDSILQGMWQLHEAGYVDMAPDVFLYTTAMNAWAQHGEMDRVRFLLNDLESRHRALQWESLERDVAVYNALLHAISKQPFQSKAGYDAGRIVKWMERQGEIHPKVKPDTITYNTLMDACLASNDDIGREHAEQTLLWMVEEYKGGNTRIKPSLKSYSSVMNAWTASGCPERAEPLLELMEERYRPPALLFESIITAYCDQADLVGSSGSAKRAMRLLERTEELFEATGNDALRPTMSLYNAVIRALSIGGDPGGAGNAVRERRDRVHSRVGSALEPVRFASSGEVFDVLQHWKDAPTVSHAPTTRNFNAVIFALKRSDKVWAGQRAEDILNYMLEVHLKRGKRAVAPDIVTFNSVMAAAAQSSQRNAGQKAQAVLEKLNALHDIGILQDVKADRVTYNTIMNAHAKSQDPKSGTHAEKVFRELEGQYHETQDEALKPDIVSYTTLLNAWAKSREPTGANRAEQILLRMLKDYKADHANVKPNTICFNLVIDAWARSPNKGASKRAEMVLQLMYAMYSSGKGDVMPNTRTFNAVLHALANSQEEDAPLRSQLLLDRMRKEGENGNDAMKPDIVSYSTAISAWAKQGSPGALNATLMLLEDFFESDIEADSGFISSLIYSLTRTGSKEAPMAAEKIVADVKRKVESGKLNMQVDTEIYNALINCWAKSGERGATSRAEEILQEMEDEYAQGSDHVKPNVQTYTSLIDAYAKNRDGDAAKRAETILNRMEDDGMVLPNVHTYTAVIQNYARSDDPAKAVRAQAILRRMKDD
jgi:pentatricopeptide repeat protein